MQRVSLVSTPSKMECTWRVPHHGQGEGGMQTTTPPGEEPSLESARGEEVRKGGREYGSVGSAADASSHPSFV